MFISFLELIEACKVNDVYTVKTLIEKNPGLISMVDTSNNNPYHICASYGNIDVLKYLLSVSSNKHYLNGLNREYRTPLHLAIEAGWTRCFKLLLDAGADIKRGVYSVATIFSFEPYVRNDYIRKLLEKALDTKESSIFNFSISNPPVILKRQTCEDNSDFKRQTCADPQITFNFNDLLEVKKSKTLKDRINESLLPEDYKKMALEKESTLTSNFSSSASKDKEWVETLLKIPFNNYSKLSISNESKIEDIQDFFKEAVSTMDEVSYGMENIKEEILDCISQMISTKNDCMPRVLCLQGPGGVGKTSFIRGGISKILKRPFKQINMGGISDASYLIGHETTYTSSKPGLIINSLIECKTMNPIIFMDEIDKISTTDKGVDIQNVLIHLTDPIQNSEFQDKYFSGVNIDLSKVLFIFSCNDDTKISPILKDRLNIIRIKQPTINDKVVIGKKYLMKELCSNVGIDINTVKIEEETIKYIINKFCKDDLGVRGLKRCLETLLLKINSAIYNPMIKYSCLKGIKMSKEKPFDISIKLVEEVLKKYEDRYSDLMNTMFL